MDPHETDVLAVHAIPVIVQDEDVVCPAPNCDKAGGLISGSRPSSQLSQNGSSGYGSTRSQVGPFGISNRPSPASSATSSSSSSNSTSSNNAKNSSNKPKRSVWFGNGSLRGQRAASAEPETEADAAVVLPPEMAKTRGLPQYASLRIPNRIRHHSSQGELPSFEDRGLDLAEAEVDSDIEAEEQRPVPAPRGMNYPLRHASSLETQVRFYLFFPLFDFLFA